MVSHTCILWRVSIEWSELFKVFRLNQKNSLRSTATIKFLEKELQIPDDVSDGFVSELRKTLNDYEKPLIELEHESIGCDGSSSQYGSCLKSYNQFKV